MSNPFNADVDNCCSGFVSALFTLFYNTNELFLFKVYTFVKENVLKKLSFAWMFFD
jgi:hypothetical protein